MATHEWTIPRWFIFFIKYFGDGQWERKQKDVGP